MGSRGLCELVSCRESRTNDLKSLAMKVIEVVLDDRLLFFVRQPVIALLQQLGHDIIFLLPFGLCS